MKFLSSIILLAILLFSFNCQVQYVSDNTESNSDSDECKYKSFATMSTAINKQICTKIKLDMSNLALTTLNGLGDITQFTNLLELELDFSKNQLTNVDEIGTVGELTKLTKVEIDLSNNPNLSAITELSKLKFSTKINKLEVDLEATKATDLTWINQLNNLVQLTSLKMNYKNTQIANLDGLLALQKLQHLTKLELDFSDNQINKIATFTEFSFLRTLQSFDFDLKNNKLTSVQELLQFLEIPQSSDIDINVCNTANDCISTKCDLDDYGDLQQLIGYKSACYTCTQSSDCHGFYCDTTNNQCKNCNVDNCKICQAANSCSQCIESYTLLEKGQQCSMATLIKTILITFFSIVLFLF